MSADKFLAEVKARAEKTTKGEWHWKAASPSTARVWADSGPVINEKIYIGDAEFISNARTDIPRLVAMVEIALDALAKTPCTGNGDVHVASCFKCARLAELDRIAAGKKCPRCGSPEPKLHPAVQSGGEVSPCSNAFHRIAGGES